MAFHCKVCDYQTGSPLVMQEHYKRAGTIHHVIKNVRKLNLIREKKIMRMRIPRSAKLKLLEVKRIRHITMGGKTYEI